MSMHDLRFRMLIKLGRILFAENRKIGCRWFGYIVRRFMRTWTNAQIDRSTGRMARA
jgi:hypothetical protein